MLGIQSIGAHCIGSMEGVDKTRVRGLSDWITWVRPPSAGEIRGQTTRGGAEKKTKASTSSHVPKAEGRTGT
jgi:hypothetical protein